MLVNLMDGDLVLLAWYCCRSGLGATGHTPVCFLCRNFGCGSTFLHTVGEVGVVASAGVTLLRACGCCPGCQWYEVGCCGSCVKPISFPPGLHRCFVCCLTLRHPWVWVTSVPVRELVCGCLAGPSDWRGICPCGWRPE